MSVLFPQEINMKQLDYIRKQCETAQNFRSLHNGKMYNVQFPKARVNKPTNLKEIKNSKSKEDKFVIDFPIEPGSALDKYANELDEVNVEFLAKNSKEIFDVERSKEEITKYGFYSSVRRVSKDKKYKDTIRLKLPVNIITDKDTKVAKGLEAKFKISVEQVDEDGNKQFKDINVNSIQDGIHTVDWSWSYGGMEIVPINSSPELWVIGKKNAYCTVRLQVVRVYSRENNRINSESFRDDSTPSEPTHSNQTSSDPYTEFGGHVDEVEEEND